MRATARWLIAAGVLFTGAGPRPAGGAAMLAVDGRIWWREDQAPIQWTGDDQPLRSAIRWRAGAPGIEWGEVRLAGSGEASALRLMVARIDPWRIALGLEWSVAPNGKPAWTVDRTAPSTVVAFNAGMFGEALPWGWAVVNGTERLGPGRGPLSSAVAVTREGEVLWRDGDQVDDLRRRSDLGLAFQSYPTLLVGDGRVPEPLRAAMPGAAIDLRHRDARLALGIDRRGWLIVALTRFDLGVPGAERIPFGLTVPEMAAVMGALGARQAMLLDGGISAQLAIREEPDRWRRWRGLRRVPLALIGHQRSADGASASPLR